jgi:DNA-binding MarR family transcriptional regulator
MPQPSPTPQQMVAELVEQLGHCACSEAFSAGLNPAQWAALRFLERANRFSRTVSAFADYHGTTRGTASQTIRALVQKGFLRRLPDERDQRSFRLELTGHARAVLDADPLAGLVSAAATLPHAQCAVLAEGLRTMLERVQDQRARRSFGVCTSCRHLCALDDEGERGCASRCTFKNAILQDGELGKICIDYQSRLDH